MTKMKPPKPRRRPTRWGRKGRPHEADRVKTLDEYYSGEEGDGTNEFNWLDTGDDLVEAIGDGRLDSLSMDLDE